MALSRTTLIGNGSTKAFTVPFPYISPTHVTVKLDDDLVPTPGWWTWLSASTIQFNNAPPLNQVILIERRTPIETALVAFQGGAVLTEADLNLAVKQLLYRQQETDDYVRDILERGLVRVTGGTSVGAEEMIDAVVQEILASTALADLNNRSTDISANAQSVAGEIVNRIGAISAEEGARIASVNNLQTQINSLADATAATVWVQATAPVPGVGGVPNPIVAGSRWYDTSNNNRAYIYDAIDGWVDITDPRIGSNANSIAILGADYTTLDGTVTGHTGQITILDSTVTTLSGDLTATSNSLNVLTAQVNHVTTGLPQTRADLVNEQIVRADGDSALSGTLSLLGAKNVGGTAFILDTATAFVGPSESLAQRFTTLQAGIDGKATITQWQEVRNDADGLLAKAGVALNVNGRIIGWSANNNGSSGEFIVQADKFAVVDPANNANVKVPFVVTGGTVYMQNVVIGDALIDTLTVGKLTNGTLGANCLVNGDLTMGTGRIIWTSANNAFVKAAGIGFGTSSQFLEWFGPRPTGGNLALCSEATAISYLKTNGDAYFGGSLSAGALKTAITGTSLAADASVETARYGSNGGSIQVVLSYYVYSETTASYGSQTEWKNAITNWGGTPPSGSGELFYNFSKSIAATASIALDRSVNGGAYSLGVTTLNVTGGTETLGGASIPETNSHQLTFTRTFSGSLTYTDPQTIAQDRQYRSRITARASGIMPYGTARSQRVSIISTEE